MSDPLEESAEEQTLPQRFESLRLQMHHLANVVNKVSLRLETIYQLLKRWEERERRKK